MAVNPLGFVQVNDFGNPQVLTGEAMETISGGQLVAVSGTTGVVSSGTSSYANSDVKFIVSADAKATVGVAMNTVTSGLPLGVLVNGVVISSCGGAVTAGYLVESIASTDSVKNLASGSNATSTSGRAYTAGASGGFALIHYK